MANFKNYSVLVVEDNAAIRESFARCLKMLFKEVYMAVNGEDGLRDWERYSPDIVITDIYLPKMTGIELAKLIREQDAKIPLLFMSGHSDPQTFIQTIPVSADGYMIKPFAFENCLENLQKCVDKLEREVYCDSVSLKGGATVNLSTKIVTANNKTSKLTPQEFKLLSLFLKSKEATLHQGVIVDSIWDGEQVSSSAIKNLLLKMRKKLGIEAIDTLVGHGYRLNLRSF